MSHRLSLLCSFIGSGYNRPSRGVCSRRPMTVLANGRRRLGLLVVPSLSCRVPHPIHPLLNLARLSFFGRVSSMLLGNLNLHGINLCSFRFRQDLRSVAIAWPLSYETPDERKAFLAAKPFTYIGSLLVNDGFVHSVLLFSVFSGSWLPLQRIDMYLPCHACHTVIYCIGVLAAGLWCCS